jgi:hypothetical protein
MEKAHGKDRFFQYRTSFKKKCLQYQIPQVYDFEKYCFYQIA